jgi:hypothetical protein
MGGFFSAPKPQPQGPSQAELDAQARAEEARKKEEDRKKEEERQIALNRRGRRSGFTGTLG